MAPELKTSSPEVPTSPELETSAEDQTSSDIEMYSDDQNVLISSDGQKATRIPKRVLDKEQTQKACTALLEHVAKHQEDAAAKSDLLEDSDVPVFLAVTFKHIPKKSRMKPIRISVKHSIPGAHDSVCLIVKEPAEQWKKAVEDLGLQGSVKKVIGIKKLRTKYKSFESRRVLCKSYDTFLADAGIPDLAKSLGKACYSKKKQPFEMNLSMEVLKGQVGLVQKSTALHITSGVSSMVKIGTTAMTAEQIAENAMAVSDAVAYRTDGGIKGLQSLFVKTANSVALPVFVSDVVFGEKYQTFEDKHRNITKAKRETKEMKEKKEAKANIRKEKKRKRKAEKEEKKTDGESEKVVDVVEKVENAKEMVEADVDKVQNKTKKAKLQNEVEKVEEEVQNKTKKVRAQQKAEGDVPIVQNKAKKVKVQNEVEEDVQKVQPKAKKLKVQKEVKRDEEKEQNKSVKAEARIESEKVKGAVEKVQKETGKVKGESDKGKGQSDKKRKR